MPSPHQILGVRPNASIAEIRKAYKKLAIKHHPDKNRGREAWANGKFVEVQSAYETLTKPRDAQGTSAAPSSAQNTHQSRPNTTQQDHSQRRHQRQQQAPPDTTHHDHSQRRHQQQPRGPSERSRPYSFTGHGYFESFARPTQQAPRREPPRQHTRQHPVSPDLSSENPSPERHYEEFNDFPSQRRQSSYHDPSPNFTFFERPSPDGGPSHPMYGRSQPRHHHRQPSSDLPGASEFYERPAPHQSPNNGYSNAFDDLDAEYDRRRSRRERYADRFDDTDAAYERRRYRRQQPAEHYDDRHHHHHHHQQHDMPHHFYETEHVRYSQGHGYAYGPPPPLHLPPRGGFVVDDGPPCGDPACPEHGRGVSERRQVFQHNGRLYERRRSQRGDRIIELEAGVNKLTVCMCVAM